VGLRRRLHCKTAPGQGTCGTAAAKAQGIDPIADPEPLRNLFVRSDQYSFIRQGLPSINFTYGAVPGSPEEKIFKAWLTERYHAPSDDLNQPVDLAAAATFEEIMRTVVVAVANGDTPPQWKPDSFFRRYAKK
jgi:Zn-dependent M28 family amino/carboxypeptidase